jgi:hypothetical protein
MTNTIKIHPVFGPLTSKPDSENPPVCEGCVFDYTEYCDTSFRHTEFPCSAENVIWVSAEEIPIVPVENVVPPRYETKTVYKFENDWQTEDKALADFVSENFTEFCNAMWEFDCTFGAVVESHYAIAKKYMIKD